MADKGRENKRDNDLFFTCSLIEYISRKTKNIRADVVNKLGETRISKIYELADVYHCDNIDSVVMSLLRMQIFAWENLIMCLIVVTHCLHIGI